MSANSSIEWTDRTWNPLTGCTKVSPGCDNCYAKTMHERFNGPGSFDTITLHPERLSQPYTWRAPARVFVNSMSDLFHKDVPDAFIADVFAAMGANPKHTFQVLTKRHARLRSLLNRDDFRRTVLSGTDPEANSYLPPWPLPNVWLGVSVENQQWADIRVPALRDTPAAVRFLSCEPLLGPVDLRARSDAWGGYLIDGIDWVIVGGESGQGARPMYQDWARSLRDQCSAAGVPFLFKQWGAWAPRGLSAGWQTDPREHWGEVVDDGKYPELIWRQVYERVGKKAAGRVLDGRTWDEYPRSLVAAGSGLGGPETSE